jgi:hypothetical protein
VYAGKPYIRAELLDRIMDASRYIRNNKPSVKTSVTSLSRSSTMCIHNQRGHLEQ